MCKIVWIAKALGVRTKADNQHATDVTSTPPSQQDYADRLGEALNEGREMFPEDDRAFGQWVQSNLDQTVHPGDNPNQRFNAWVSPKHPPDLPTQEPEQSSLFTGRPAKSRLLKIHSLEDDYKQGTTRIIITLMALNLKIPA